jgi:malate synthase
MTMFKAHKNTDIITFKVTEFTRSMNKDMMPKFEELEKKRFRGHLKAYNHVCETYGSAFLECCVQIFANGERISYHQLKI